MTDLIYAQSAPANVRNRYIEDSVQLAERLLRLALNAANATSTQSSGSAASVATDLLHVVRFRDEFNPVFADKVLALLEKAAIYPLNDTDYRAARLYVELCRAATPYTPPADANTGEAP